MKGRNWVLAILLATSALCFAKAANQWLQKVPPAERSRVNPYAGRPDAVAAGAILYHNNCAQCHGDDADGKFSRPSLRTEEVRSETDGELAWLLKNGDVYRGMPRWSGLPEQERWQIIAYMRSLGPSSFAETQK
ncbi:MAG: c-type cytochrome [Acidobacteriota bacterium]